MARTPAAQCYARAHELHYGQRKLDEALVEYERLCRTFPADPAAPNARAQIRNIVRSVVPEPELLGAEIALAREFLVIDHTAPAPASVEMAR